MKTKPISPGLHNLTDYAFGAALMTVPKLIGADQETVKRYRILAIEIFVYSALTKQPYALKPLIPMSVHQKIDFGNLGLLALLHCYPRIKRNRPVSFFNLGMTILGAATVLLTNWKSGEE